MIICFKTNSVTRERLDFLVGQGDYRDYGEVISIAVSNLISIHEEFGSDPIILEKEEFSPKTPLRQGVMGKTKSIPEPKNRINSTQPVHIFTKIIPDIFQNLPPKNWKIPLVEPDMGVWKRDDEVPIENWIFGQYNKILPAKVSIRGLCNIVYSSGGPVDIDKAGSMISKEATYLTEVLSKLDEILGNSRDDVLATAFPSHDAEMKSISRFKNQFFGSVSKEGKLSGLLSELKLINHINDSSSKILPTKAGWEFAQKPNPILDSGGTIQRFGEEEVNFLINHILDNVYREKYAYKLLLQYINQGINTPSLIDQELKKTFIINQNSKVSESFLSTQRSGTISRMCDLGIVQRDWQGTMVIYKKTNLSDKFLTQK